MSEEKKQPDDRQHKGEKIPQEVRYIPVEYLPEMHNEEDEIDLIELGKNIWDGRWTIAKITSVFVAIGLFIALFSPVEYESEAILMPEVQQQQDRAGQLLQQFGGAFGFGGSTTGQMQQTGTIPPMIYPRIVNSLSFQVELIQQPIQFADYGVTTTIFDFYENHYRRSLTELFVDYTVKLPFTIMGTLRNEDNGTELREDDPFQAEFIRVSKKELELVDDLRGRISVGLDEQTGLLTSRVRLHDRNASAELNRQVIELLKQYVTDYRVEKVRQDLEFVEGQYEHARERFEGSQMILAEFRDQNISLATARAQTELERLQDEKDLAFNLYNSLSQQLEQAKLRVQEQKPVFSFVQTVNIPVDHSSPKIGLILVLSVLLGLLSGLGYLFFNIFMKNIKE